MIQAPLPALPRLAIRIGLVGNRAIPPEMSVPIAVQLDRILAATVAALTRVSVIHGAQVARFYSRDAKPLLRLITGLAEGADALGVEALLRLQANAASVSHADAEMAAVLPFDVQTYRDSREPDFLPQFDRYAALCTHILELDGILEKPTPDTPSAKRRRARAYRAQAAYLLRQSDLVVVVADASDPGRAGGAMETLRTALAFGLPVAFIDTATATVRLIEPESLLETAVNAEPQEEWDPALSRVIERIVADPDQRLPPNNTVAEEGAGHFGLLEDFFRNQDIPPMTRDATGMPARRKSFRERFWMRFDAGLRKASGVEPKPGTEPKLSPYDQWRDRATALNYDGAGLYRGAFLDNYLLAVLAVALAATSLAIIGYAPGSLHLSQIHWVLLGMAALKLIVVVSIYRNTRQANQSHWNERAIDFRYLAERLRALYYLPRLGSFQPPFAATPEYSLRMARQSAVDWLLDAITRSVSADQALPTQVQLVNGSAAPYEVRVAKIAPLATLKATRQQWIGGQIDYHRGNARVMKHLHELLERWSATASKAVIGIVLLDISLVTVEIMFPHHGTLAAVALHYLAVFLILCATILPAAVASMNGIRFQSECQRLHERSSIMCERLAARELELRTLEQRIETAQAAPESDPGAWAAEGLHLVETIARDFAREVGEWSVLYARDVPET